MKDQRGLREILRNLETSAFIEGQHPIKKVSDEQHLYQNVQRISINDAIAEIKLLLVKDIDIKKLADFIFINGEGNGVDFYEEDSETKLASAIVDKLSNMMVEI